MDTRKQDLEALQEMQRIHEKIDKIDCRLAEIENGVNRIYVNKNLYNTNHEEECKKEKKDKQEKITVEYAKKKKQKTLFLLFIPLTSIAFCVVASILARPLSTLAATIAMASFVITPILTNVMKKRISAKRDEEICKIEKEYELKLQQAEKEDEAEESRYRDDLIAARNKYRAEHRAECKKLETEKIAHQTELEKIRIISKSDMLNIHQLIRILDSNRASNIKEALLELDNQKRISAEKKRREIEEEKRRKAEEEARRATMPGRVHVRIGSINIYSGALRTVRNTIYFDGAQYGVGDATGNTVFQLNPGVHNAYAQLAEAGYIFTSPNQSFVLPGDSDIYLKITLKNARADIRLCNSESDFRSD